MVNRISAAQRQQQLERLQTDEGMARLLDIIAGKGRWTYLEDADIWVVPDESNGAERSFTVYRRGGVSFKTSLSP